MKEPKESFKDSAKSIAKDNLSTKGWKGRALAAFAAIYGVTQAMDLPNWGAVIDQIAARPNVLMGVVLVTLAALHRSGK